jgi:hypothetical protein
MSDCETPESPPEPMYAPGDRVIIAHGGVYHNAEVVPMEPYWSERTARGHARVRLDDGRRLRIPLGEIVQRAT